MSTLLVQNQPEQGPVDETMSHVQAQPRSVPRGAEAKSTSSKKTAALMYIAVSFVMVVSFLMISRSGRVHDYIKANAPEGFERNTYGEIWPIASLAIILWALKLTVCFLTMPFFAQICKEQVDRRIKRRMTRKAAYSCAKMIFFTGLGMWGHYLMTQTDYLPWYLGGPWDKSNHLVEALVSGSPFIETPQMHRWFFNVALGHFISDFFDTVLFQRYDPNYSLMMLHHIAASALIWCCIQTNMVRVGILCLEINNGAEQSLFFARIAGCTNMKELQLVAYSILTPIWIYTRIFCLGYFVIDMQASFKYPEHLDPHNVLSFSVVTTMTSLFMLNCFWGQQQISILNKLINEYRQGKFTFAFAFPNIVETEEANQSEGPQEVSKKSAVKTE